eukprot:6848237-Lingulodinium_polyedra.AAC.1
MGIQAGRRVAQRLSWSRSPIGRWRRSTGAGGRPARLAVEWPASCGAAATNPIGPPSCGPSEG